MRRLIGIALVLVTLLWSSRDVRAQAYGTELPFVLGTDARISAMGLAGVSLRGDASIQYYNPAGMSYLQWRQLSVFRAVLFDSDALYHTISYGHPLLNYGTIGISVLRVDVGGIEERDDKNQLLSDDLHNSQTRVLLGYSKHITSSIATGFNIKIDNQSFGAYSGSGVGLDVGIGASQVMSGHSFIRGFRQGFAIQNLIEPALKLDQEVVADPMQVSVGLTMLSGFGHAYMETAIDLISPRFSPARLQIGQEITYDHAFSFRFGLNGASPSYGLGAKYKSAALDYAYRDTEIGGNHQFSVSFRFGSSLSQQKSQARARLEHQVNNQINVRMDELERTQITSALQEGDSLFALGEYTKASGRFESALLWDPDNDHAAEYLTRSEFTELMNWCNAAVKRGDFVQGLFHARQALALVPGDSDALAMIDLCNRQITESQNSAEMVNNLLKTSIDLYANRDFAQALAGFEELMRLAPSNALAVEYRQKCLLQIQELVQGHLNDSRTAAERGDYDTALQELQRALAFEPGSRAIQSRIAELERESQNAAPPAVKKAILEPAPHARLSPADASKLEEKYKRGMEFFNKGQFDKAVGLFMEVWTTAPNLYDVGTLLTKSYLLIGMRLYSKDDYEAAIEVWKKALAIDPDNVKVKRYLARTDAEFRKSRASND